jgi:beta-aspartyl-peptidase (threonine type)
MANYKIIVHGGAWDIPKQYHEDHKNGVEQAVLKGQQVLRSGGSAMDACIAAVTCLEDDPTFDAGKGAFLNDEGKIELDAIVMDGTDLSIGSVAAVQNIKNPVQLANAIRLKSEHCVLVGEGALKYAKAQGQVIVAPEDLLVGRELERYKELLSKGVINAKQFFDKPSKMGTVGAVAIDEEGNIACATSTGGTPNKMAGRVGDSPLPGSGAYANKNGGASTTGWGESIMKVVLAKTTVDGIEHGLNAQEAADKAIKILEREVQGLAGVIIIDKNYNVSYSYNTPFMARAIADESGLIHVAV